jgi:hypothetical protein
VKRLMILVLLIGIEARAQSLADLARAERLRQRNVEAKLKVNIRGEKVAAPAAERQKAEAPENKPEEKKELTAEEKLLNERVDIIKKRSELLVRMGQYRDDPEAVKAIELELMELSKRSETAKLQHLGKPQPAAEK